MMSRMAKVDGNFSRDEKRFINSSLDIDSTSIAIGERVLISDDLSNIFIDLIASKDGVDKKFSRQLVTNLFEIARIDGTVDDAELKTLENFSKKLGLTAPDFNKLKAQAREETLELVEHLIHQTWIAKLHRLSQKTESKVGVPPACDLWTIGVFSFSDALSCEWGSAMRSPFFEQIKMHPPDYSQYKLRKLTPYCQALHKTCVSAEKNYKNH